MFVCMYMCMQVHMYVYVCDQTCGGQRSISGSFLSPIGHFGF